MLAKTPIQRNHQIHSHTHTLHTPIQVKQVINLRTKETHTKTNPHTHTLGWKKKHI